jgi:hypothetical protein
MSWLVRLYPPSWRKRYGRELDALVEEMPGRVGVALDLLGGAAIAYRDVVRSNRILSAAGAYLHGLCIAILLQAIAFVSMIMVAQGSADQTVFRVGPLQLATFAPQVRYALSPRSLEAPAVWMTKVAQTLVPEIVLLAALVATLAGVLAAPRLLRSLR